VREQEAHLSIRKSERGRERERERERIYKGELGDYDLPFVRSFQLFCPIKISIFSPIIATPAGSPFAASPALCHPPPPPLPHLPPPPPFASFVQPPVQPSHVALHTLTSTVPKHPCPPSLPPPPADDSSPSHPLAMLHSHRFLSRSFSFPPPRPSVSFSLSRSPAPAVHTAVHLSSPPSAIPAPIFNYWLRGCLRSIRGKSGKSRVAHGIGVHANGRVRFAGLPHGASQGGQEKRDKGAVYRAVYGASEGRKEREEGEGAGGRERERERERESAAARFLAEI